MLYAWIGGCGCVAAAKCSSLAVIQLSCCCRLEILLAINEFVSVRLLIAEKFVAKAEPKLETVSA